MKITVNDTPRQVPAGTRVAEVLGDLALAQRRGLAIALNDEVVPRVEWNTRALEEGDALLILRASQGG